MAVPTHDSTCITFIVPTACNRCGTKTYYFQCSHGSKVFFETLGYPWRPHLCDFDVIDETIDELLEQGFSEKELLKIIYAKGNPDDVKKEIIETKLGLKTNRQSIRQISDLSNEFLITGIIHTINLNINFFKRFNINADNLLSLSLSGDIGKYIYDEIIIRSEPDKKNVINEYHIFLRHDLKSKVKVSVGSKITTPIRKIATLLGDFWEIEASSFFWDSFEFNFKK